MDQIRYDLMVKVHDSVDKATIDKIAKAFVDEANTYVSIIY